MWKNVVGKSNSFLRLVTGLLSFVSPWGPQRRISWYSSFLLFVLIRSLMPACNQVGTHADSLIAEAVIKGVQGFDLEVAWESVWKDATVPPKDDMTVS
jgi:hypothetical protein